MRDPRIDQLADIVVEYSTKVKKGDIVQIDFHGAAPLPLVTAIHKRCLKKGALHVETQCLFPEIKRSFYDNATPEQIDYFPRHQLNFMKKVDVYIAIRGDENSKTLASTNSKIVSRRSKILKPIQDQRVKHTRWCVLIYPNEGVAQDAGMSLEEFEDFYFDACIRDWKALSKNMSKLEKLMAKTNDVHIKASDTDLRFSIKDMPAVKCDGQLNMPDGEVFTAPVKTSVEGHIQYNTPSPYQGKEFKSVRLEFKKGQIIKATCDGDSKALDDIFNTDPGARYIGEFAIGVNQGIQAPIKEILFDEKIGGSIHFTPGACYDECDNGNKSAVHWDLVKILKGDGEIYFDGKLVQKDGRWVLPALKALNES